MRREIVVLGFFLIVLILVAGCSSKAPSRTSSKAPSISTTSPGSSSPQVSTTVCSLPPQDPHRFKKNFPNVPGWVGAGEDVDYHPEEMCNERGCDNLIVEVYENSDPSNKIRMYVVIKDFGPCLSKESESGGNAENIGAIASPRIKRSFINNFHGYPAIHVIQDFDEDGNMDDVSILIVIKNGLTISIRDLNTYGQPHSLSDAEANIEKFANAIDFNAIASSV